MLFLDYYRIIIGGNDGKVTPPTRPWHIRRAKLIHKLSLDAIGKSSDKMEQSSAELPSTSFVPNFSAKEPPNI